MAATRLPPGPESWCFGLNFLARLRRDTIGFCRELQGSYGDAVSYRCGPNTLVQFQHPAAIREVLETKSTQFVKAARLRQVLKPLQGDSLFLSSGAVWRKQEAQMQPEFREEVLRPYGPTVARLAGEEVERRWGPGVTVDAETSLVELALSMVSDTLLGARRPLPVRALREAMMVIQSGLVRDMSRLWVPPMWWPTPSRRELRAAIDLFRSVAADLVAERRREPPGGNDVVSRLVAVPGLSDQAICDEICTLLIAGHDTIAHALTWTVWYLAQYPEIQDACAGEAAALAGGDAFAAGASTPLIEAVVKEAMRLRPPAYILQRDTAETVEIAGWTLPPKATIEICLYTLHRDPRWFADPDAFRPDRFLGNAQSAMTPFSYLPFGAGPRHCIGDRFALMTARTVLAVLLSRCRVALAPGYQGDPGCLQQITLRPAREIGVVVEPR